MGISRDSIHKKKLTGGKKRIWKKKRKHELGRQASNTKIGPKQLSLIRTRGGNIKKRALLVESGNFSMISSGVSRKTKVLRVVFNSTNNELVRTNTLVKGSIIFVDAAPFKVDFFEKKKNFLERENFAKNKKKDQKKSDGIREELLFIHLMKEQFLSGKLMARICSRPGQSGRVDGYLLEKGELEYYLKKIQKKKSR
jgi:small subunit ribosomal protein S8e